MQVTRMRPTFALDVGFPAEEAVERIRQTLSATDQRSQPYDSQGYCVELFLPRAERHIWSPYLSLQFEDTPTGSELRGRFSPRPELWTFLMFLYFMTGTITFFAAMLGISQWMIDQSPWGWYVVPVGIAIITSIHVTSLIGQVRAHHQMEQLRERLDELLQQALAHDFQERGL